ncbi:phosphotransferase [Pseudonocardia adelaidensis]|uniref:Phosphotransferase n=1 Tax=Pseudonocardia adelaidensis TaxID=648754 RepID=A0ABP9NW74_9PSEU
MLRRYREHGRGEVTREAAAMAHVTAHGFPAPRVFTAAGTDLVMERLYGPVLLDAVAAGDHDVHDAGRVLADLHGRLHALPPRPGAPGERLLHLDLHPANVVLTASGPVLIDWTNAADGPPGLDVALSAVILAQAAVEPGHEYAGVAAEMLTAFLGAAEEDPLPMLDGAIARRAADRSLSEAEVALLADAAALVTAAAT